MGTDGVDGGGGADSADHGDNDGPDISDESREALESDDRDDGDSDDGGDPAGADGTDAGIDTPDDELTEDEAQASQERLEAEGREAQAHAEEQMAALDAPVGEEVVDTPVEEEIDLDAAKEALSEEIDILADETYTETDPDVFADEVAALMDENPHPELQEHIAQEAVRAISERSPQNASYPAAALLEAQSGPEQKGHIADAIVNEAERIFDAGDTDARRPDPFDGLAVGMADYGRGFQESPEAGSYVAEAFAERARTADEFGTRALDAAIAIDVVTAAETLPRDAERITTAMADVQFGQRHTEMSTELYEAIDAGRLHGEQARDLITGTLDHTIAMDDLSANLDRGLSGDRYRDALAGAMAKAHDTGPWDTAPLRQALAEQQIDAALGAYLDANPTTRMLLSAAWNDPGQAAIGAGKNFVNGIVGLAELGAGATLHLGGYVNDGFAAIADTAGFQSAAAHAANAEALHDTAAGIDWQPFELTNHAQQGGAIIGTGVEMGLGLAALARVGATSLARHADDFPTTAPVAAAGTRAIDSARPYEQAIRDLYNGVTLGRREFDVIVDGQIASRYADDVILVDGLETAVDAKFVRDWDTSIRNPQSPIGDRDWALPSQEEMLAQARNYSEQFPGGAIYHTNNVELARHYDTVFREAGIDNIQFVITPTR